MRARNTTTRRRQHCVCVSILRCVCDTASWYTHGQENTVCGTPFRLDDDQMELAANARHARVWRGGARTGRHDGLASRPLRNVEPALRARTSAKLSRWRHSSSSDLHVSGRRGVRVGRSVAAFKQDLVCERERASLGVVVVLVVVVYPHVLLCSSQAATSDYPELPFRLRTQLLLTSPSVIRAAAVPHTCVVSRAPTRTRCR
jgi:hypothetical protein